MVNEGRFPKPMKISQEAIAWRMAELLDWQEGVGQ
jgi:predicted DNA-binding transcriptional regulator AlpA